MQLLPNALKAKFNPLPDPFLTWQISCSYLCQGPGRVMNFKCRQERAWNRADTVFMATLSIGGTVQLRFLALGVYSHVKECLSDVAWDGPLIAQ